MNLWWNDWEIVWQVEVSSAGLADSEYMLGKWEIIRISSMNDDEAVSLEWWIFHS